MEKIASPKIARVTLPWTVRSVFGVLRKFRKGHLRVSLPDGEVVHFGEEPHGEQADVTINDLRVFRMVLLSGDIGLGESYILGMWHSSDLSQLIRWFIVNIQESPFLSGGGTGLWRAMNVFKFLNKLQHFSRTNTRMGSRRNIAAHYDLSNEFYRLFLGESMVYSCADFSDPHVDLEAAQQAKYRGIAKQLRLQPHHRVLEIGTGWGGLAIYLAKESGCYVKSITISRQQYDYAKALIKKEGIKEQVTVELCDYRDVEGHYDRIVSIEMLEAVGHRYLRPYFDQCHRLLDREGLLLLQVITSPHSRYNEIRKGVDFIQKHIFPGSLLPSLKVMSDHMLAAGDFEVYSARDMGASYARTLREWRLHFEENLGPVKDLGFDDQFIRKWQFYLSYCEAAFIEKNISVRQMLCSRPNNTQLHL